MKKLSKATAVAIATLVDELSADLERAQEYFDERSEKWQESEAGEDYQAWIERLEEIEDALNDVPEAPGAA